LRTGTFDVLIIGGGINGAGVARDIALRAKTSNTPLRTAVVEKHHFGSGTSGRNSHLIHGGLRYLKYFDFTLVREALRERAVLLEIAPHLVEPLAFLMPFRTWPSAVFYETGLAIYDLLAGKAGIKPYRGLTRREMKQMDPSLLIDNFRSGALFYDARVASARLVLENVIEAVRNGVVAVNYVEVIERQRSKESWKVRVRDHLLGDEIEINARILIDATGAWTETKQIRLVRGSHIVVPHRRSREHAIAYFETSGRIVFFVPWGEARDLLLVGTTDVDHDKGPEDVHISPEETTYLLAITRKVLREDAIGEPVAAFSSLRPLVREKGRSATSTSREHHIFRDDDGIVRITGGKYTTYRAMSEEAVDLACPLLRGQCTTARMPLNGNSREALDRLSSESRLIAARHRIPEGDVQRLIHTYGVHLPVFLELLRSESEAAPIMFAAKHEMAQRLRDVLFVSTTWGYEERWSFQRVVDYALVLGRYLGWDAGRVNQEAEDVMSSLGSSICRVDSTAHIDVNR
jgi:glycerol-3-phosphate dehydrogenase